MMWLWLRLVFDNIYSTLHRNKELWNGFILVLHVYWEQSFIVGVCLMQGVSSRWPLSADALFYHWTGFQVLFGISWCGIMFGRLCLRFYLVQVCQFSVHGFCTRLKKNTPLKGCAWIAVQMPYSFVSSNTICHLRSYWFSAPWMS